MARIRTRIDATLYSLQVSCTHPRNLPTVWVKRWKEIEYGCNSLVQIKRTYETLPVKKLQPRLQPYDPCLRQSPSGGPHPGERTPRQPFFWLSPLLTVVGISTGDVIPRGRGRLREKVNGTNLFWPPHKLYRSSYSPGEGHTGRAASGRVKFRANLFFWLFPKSDRGRYLHAYVIPGQGTSGSEPRAGSFFWLSPHTDRGRNLHGDIIPGAAQESGPSPALLLAFPIY